MTALVFVALMAFSVVLAFMAKRGVIADSMDDVMVAGRSFGAFMVFFVTVGETYGIGTMIGVPGAIYSKGVSYSLWFLGYILLGFVVGYFMNPAIWRMGKISGAMTMPDCFRWRYGSKALEVLVAVICIVFLLPWMQMQFAGLATILRYIGWDISYTVGIGISAAIAYLYIAVAAGSSPSTTCRAGSRASSIWPSPISRIKSLSTRSPSPKTPRSSSRPSSFRRSAFA